MIVSQMVSAAVVQLIQQDRFLGEMILQLPRHFNDYSQAKMGLSWQENQLVLTINPLLVKQLRQDELVSLLAHEALHLVWQHPLRYANYYHPLMAQAATDIAVNQYLADPPAGTATLAQVAKVLRKKLAPKLDSQDYLNFLENTTIEQRERLKHQGIKLEGTGQGNQADDSHRGWRNNHPLSNQLLQQQELARIVKKAWEQVPQRDRGLLPGNVAAQLASSGASHDFSWEQLLQQQIGLIAHGRQESHARFNRRQPLRMDLAGTITHLVPTVKIFVDHSGSVTDKELSSALMTVAKFAHQADLPASVYAFDAQVDQASRQVLTLSRPVKLVRHGGGGTRFQSVFDFLRAHQVPASTLIIIVTDGWGEVNIRSYHYRHVCWLMMTKKAELSVKHPVGLVLEMGKRK